MQLVEKAQDRTEWLAQRKRTPDGLVSFGGSDAPILMGASQFKTRADLFVEKASTEVKESATTDAMHTGNRLEPALIAEAADKIGVSLHTPGVLYREGQWLITADGVDNAEAPSVCVEAKTTSRYSIRTVDDIPPMYLWQMWAQQMVLGCPVYLSVLDRDLRLSVLECPISPHAHEALKLEAEVMGEWILRGEPMPDDINNFSAEAISALFKSTTREVQLDADALNWIEALDEARAMAQQAERLEKDAKDHLARLMLDAEVATFNGMKVLSWKTQQGRATIDVARMRQDHPDLVAQYEKAGSPFRVFRTHRKKG
jgi:predicted phage-related endonuclease